MPKDDALIAELTAPTYSFTSTGKMVVESKADMKKRGMRSPDLADAFLLIFACIPQA
jgi:phage terminase large subunit